MTTPVRRNVSIGSAASARDALEDGGIACLPTESSWLLACLAGSREAVSALRAQSGPPPAIAFASWMDARLFVDPTRTAHVLAEQFLPGPLGIICQPAEGGEFSDLTGPGGGLEVSVPAHSVPHDLLGELGPMVIVQLPVSGDAEAARQHLAALGVKGCAIVLGVAGPSTRTTVDARGEPVVVREGVIPKQEVEAACR